MFAYHVEAYRFLRDHAKPYTQQDAADLAKIRAPQPPSRSLRKRIRRSQLGLSPRVEHAPRAYAPSPVASEIDRRREFFHRTIAQLGGSLTVRAAPHHETKAGGIRWVDADRNKPIEPKSRACSEAEVAELRARADRKTTILALSRMIHTEYQPDMLEVIELFGSIEEYNREKAL